MRMKRNEKYILDLATNIVGKNLLASLLEKREKKMIRKGVIRQVFIHEVRKVVSDMSFSTLGEICAFGNKLGRDEMIVTSGNNPRAAIFLDTNDSSEVLLEKIVVATILSAIDKLINDGKPNFAESWARHDLVENEEPSEIKRLKQVMGW